MLHTLAGLSAGAIAAASIIPYLRDIAQGRTKPARGTYIAKSALGIAFAGSYWRLGAGAAVWTATVFAVTPVLVLVCSIRNGIGGWGRQDRIVLLGTASGLIMWFETESPEAMVLIAVTLKWLSLTPTLAKLRQHPRTESEISWRMALIGDAVNLAAIPSVVPLVIIAAVNEFLMSAAVLRAIGKPHDSASETFSTSVIDHRGSSPTSRVDHS